MNRTERVSGFALDDRPPEWGFRSDSGPVPIGELLPLVMKSIELRAIGKGKPIAGSQIDARPGDRGQEDRR